MTADVKPCENCGHVERVFFQCPACGRSFEVKGEQSQRIFCSSACARLLPPVSVEARA